MIRSLIKSLPLLFLLINCTGSHEGDQNGTDKKDKKENAQKEKDPENYGADFDIKEPLTPKALVDRMEEKDSLNVTMKGEILAVCQKKGCWMDMKLPDERRMKVRFKNYGFFVPKDIKGDSAVIKGKAKHDTVPAKMLRHYARDNGKSEEEVRSIQEPEERLTFLAKGVFIK